MDLEEGSDFGSLWRTDWEPGHIGGEYLAVVKYLGTGGSDLGDTGDCAQGGTVG